MKKVFLVLILILIQISPVYASSMSDEITILQSVEAKMKESVLKGSSTIDLTSLHLSNSEDNQHIVLKTLKYSPYLYQFYDSSRNYKFMFDSTSIKSIDLNTTIDVSGTQATFDQVDAKLEEIKSLVSFSMSDYEKALTIHDYLVLNSEYDTNVIAQGTTTSSTATSGGLLLENTGVCDGYSYAFQYMMNLLGINCLTVESYSMNHSWNIIELDGSYYHVDVTFDDPVEDQFGKVRHDYFLLSDEAIQSGNGQSHYGWSGSLTCDNTQYDSDSIKKISSPVYRIGDDTIGIIDNAIVKNDTVLKTLDLWFLYGSMTQFWQDYYSGLIVDGSSIYYNSSSKIYKMSLDGSNEEIIYDLADTSVGYIYGIREKDHKIEYVLKKEPGDSGIIQTLDITLSDSNYTDSFQQVYDDLTGFVDQALRAAKSLWR